MNIFFFLICTVCALVVMFVLILCLARGPKSERRKLLSIALPLGVVILLRFGGAAMLSQIGMGWRCTPRYAMNFVFGILLFATAYRCNRAFTLSEDTNPFQPAIYWFCRLVLAVTLFLIPFSMVMLSADNFHEEVIVHNGQTMIREYKINGGAVNRFYLPVNRFFHGEALGYDLYSLLPPPAETSTE